MKLTRALKKQDIGLDNRTEKKSPINKAGMLLTDDDIQQVSGGAEEYWHAPYLAPTGPCIEPPDPPKLP